MKNPSAWQHENTKPSIEGVYEVLAMGDDEPDLYFYNGAWWYYLYEVLGTDPEGKRVTGLTISNTQNWTWRGQL